MRFAMTGVAGYVASRHIKAINETGNELVAALDPHDSVGILDSFFPGCEFFTEYERFDRHLERLRRNNMGVDFVSVCSPNYLHDAHCRLAMRIGANVICEKPLVISPWNLDQLSEIEKETRKKVFVVLQLRYHPELIRVKKTLNKDFYDVNIRYITPRGLWYYNSWKGNENKSGGLVANIGVHLLDLVLWYFGKIKECTILNKKPDRLTGVLILERAKVNFDLSINKNDLLKNEKVHRSITINGESLRFDKVFNDLHIEVYKDILNGGGLGIEDARPVTELVHKIRSM